jgi:hypothetical protein
VAKDVFKTIFQIIVNYHPDSIGNQLSIQKEAYSSGTVADFHGIPF